MLSQDTIRKDIARICIDFVDRAEVDWFGTGNKYLKLKKKKLYQSWSNDLFILHQHAFISKNIAD